MVEARAVLNIALSRRDFFKEPLNKLPFEMRGGIL